ncbi:MAG: trypsin-like peptidase domain-containing protein [Oscillospiraceae bacterium]|nr:trypsin-like peptidase domain-containing protein [Oscillospiraceae bacterium]
MFDYHDPYHPYIPNEPPVTPEDYPEYMPWAPPDAVIPANAQPAVGQPANVQPTAVQQDHIQPDPAPLDPEHFDPMQLDPILLASVLPDPISPEPAQRKPAQQEPRQRDFMQRDLMQRGSMPYYTEPELPPMRSPIYDAAATARPPRRKFSVLPLLALCLCFTLLGGALGGFIVYNMAEFAPASDPAAIGTTIPAATATTAPGGEGQEGDNTPGGGEKQSGDEEPGGAEDPGGGEEQQSGSDPIVYQPDKVLTPAQIYDMANMGVVAISTETTVRNVFGQPATQASAGSGFIISEDGYIVTNNHVIEGATTIMVILAGGESYTAKLVGRDAAEDTALLKIEAEGLTALTWGDSDSLRVGDPVVAIGNPLGELANSMTSGIVSALDRSVNIDGTPMTMLQVDASVSPGNSGGPLFDQYGQVIGIVSAKSSGSGVEGIGFAIPSKIAQYIIDQLHEHGYVVGRPWLGISIQEVDESMSQYYNLPVGVYVVTVEPGSCAEKAGLITGDVIIAFGGDTVRTQEDLVGRKNTCKAGDTVEVKLVRAGQEMTLEVTLDEMPPDEETSQESPDLPPWMPRQDDTGM